MNASSPSDAAATQRLAPEAFAERARAIEAEIGRVIVGQRDLVRQTLTGLLANSHVLLEGVPGLGKTMLVRTIGDVIDCSFNRIQFTPDLMPADITGTNILVEEGGGRVFRFQPGPIFANLVLADEINRATPKTQSSLLEAMQEHQVTVARQRFPLEAPFFVLATQNPLEMEGTYPLPEAQRDRFTARVSMGYPDRVAELAMLDDRATADPLATLQPVADAADVRDLVAAVGLLHVSEAVRRYVVALVEASRHSPHLRLGASPRAGLQLLRAARASAALSGRDHVLPDDVQALATPVLAHRLLLTADAALGRRSAEQVVAELLSAVPVPRGR